MNNNNYKNNQNIDMSEIPNNLRFPRLRKSEEWDNYIKRCDFYVRRFLNRKLAKREYNILYDFKSERNMNYMLYDLYTKWGKQFYVPRLTRMHGDCLFESLIYHGIGKNVMDLRKGLACIMYLFKDYKNFFPGNETSIVELFEPFNEIEYVICRNDKDKNKIQFYKYTFNVMCQDLCNQFCWDRLPTELILMVVSLIYKVKIHIKKNEGDYSPCVNVYENCPPEEQPQLRTIYLGHLGESHYVPLDVLGENEVIDPMYYDESKNDFLKWVKYIEFNVYKRYLLLKSYRNNNSSKRKIVIDDQDSRGSRESKGSKESKESSRSNRSNKSNNNKQNNISGFKQISAKDIDASDEVNF